MVLPKETGFPSDTVAEVDGSLRLTDALQTLYTGLPNDDVLFCEHHRLNYNGKLVSATADLVAIRDRLYAGGHSLRAYCKAAGMSEKDYSRVASRMRAYTARLPNVFGNQPVLPAPVDEPANEPVPVPGHRKYLSGPHIV